MRLLLMTALLLVGCGPAMRSGPLNPGRASASPSMECLPDPDVPDAELSRTMRFGLQLAEQSFLIAAPPAPDDRSAANLEVWSTDILGPWLQRKTHTIEAARRELDTAAEQTHRQRIIGGAIVGLMYEDLARVLRAVPPPAELEDEPEIQEMFRDTMRGQARPFLEHARRAYSACAQNAVRPDGMRHWSRFCRERGDQLPDAPVQAGPASGETTVEVLVD
ncbi:MAG: hypothetical protein AB8I08_27910 [Sandaracinaceae bacterium]